MLLYFSTHLFLQPFSKRFFFLFLVVVLSSPAACYAHVPWLIRSISITDFSTLLFRWGPCSICFTAFPSFPFFFLSLTLYHIFKLYTFPHLYRAASYSAASRAENDHHRGRQHQFPTKRNQNFQLDSCCSKSIICCPFYATIITTATASIPPP